jgi:hypothetical protein
MLKQNHKTPISCFVFVILSKFIKVLLSYVIFFSNKKI